MEQAIVSAVTKNVDEARIILHNVEDHPGVAGMVFGKLADANVVVDMIIQNQSDGNTTDLTFTVPEADIKTALGVCEEILGDVGAKEITHRTDVAKVSIVGVGMRNHSGVAATMFKALADAGINILMISTSEIKISVVIDKKYTELAVRELHAAFQMDQA